MSNSNKIKNKALKVIFEETIPTALAGYSGDFDKLADSLENYTWTYSRLKYILKSHKSFLYNLIKPFEPTDSIIFGNLLHDMVLEGDLSKYVSEKIDGRTKAGKARKLEIKEQNLIVVKPGDYKRAENCVKQIEYHNEASTLLKQEGVCEEWLEGNMLGYNIGGFIDKNAFNAWELKSSVDCSKDKFMRQSIDLGYTMQAYIYKTLSEKDVKYLCIESGSPHDINVFKPSLDYIGHGKMLFYKAIEELDLLIDTLRTGYLLSYNQNESSVLPIPQWEKKKLLDWSEQDDN